MAVLEVYWARFANIDFVIVHSRMGITVLWVSEEFTPSLKFNNHRFCQKHESE